MALAEKYHAGQTRKVLGPKSVRYVIHCFRPAYWLIKQKIKNPDLLIATILHDTLEDTSLSPQEIKKHFNSNIFMLVLGVTRPRLPRETEKEKRTNKPLSFKKILKSNKSIRLIKTADLFDNMRSWPYIIKGNPLYKKLPRWVDEAEQYYIPIARKAHQKAATEMKKILKKTKDRI